GRGTQQRRCHLDRSPSGNPSIRRRGASRLVPFLPPPRRTRVARRLHCPRCGSRKYWVLADGRRRCARCRLDWRPGRLPLRLTPRQWRQIMGWYVRDVPADAIARETGVHRKRVLRALTVVRTAIHRALADEDTPPVLPAGATMPVAIGLRIGDEGPVAEPVPVADPRALRARSRPAADPGTPAPEFASYAAIVWRDRLRWTREPTEAERSEIGAFWAFVRRQLTSRGGRRRERL